MGLEHARPGIDDTVIGLHCLGLGGIPFPVHCADGIDGLISCIVLCRRELHDIRVGRPSGAGGRHNLGNECNALAEINFKGIRKVTNFC